jgi:putative MATE family efflux protein
MKDLTQGPIPRHLLTLAWPIAIGMVFQTLYYLIDLYFVAALGDEAIAGVGAAGNTQFIVMALTQVLGVGTMALISHAVGRKDREDANLIFNQSLLLAAGCGIATLVGGYALSGMYLRSVAADPGTAAAGVEYLYWFLPGLALQFAMVVLSSALRGTGIAQPTMLVQMITIVANAVLAPILIAGWLTGYPMGVAGAGLASSIAIALGVVLLVLYFVRLEKYVGFVPTLMRAQWPALRRILAIGLPPGGEFALFFVFMSVIYAVISGFGSHSQAGFGIGTRVMQALFLPAMALAFAAAPLAGQNMGARKPERVRATFRTAALYGSVLMALLTLIAQWQAERLLQPFSSDPAVIAVGADYLRIISWNFVAQGLIFTCSGMFQALGNTMPALVTSATRVLTFALPAIWLSHRPGFELRQIWYLSVATVALQVLMSLGLLMRELRRRLDGPVAPAGA